MQNQYVMPLAAMCQISKLVQKCARYGTFNENEVEGFLKSIINTSPERPEDVYPDKFAIKTGCRTLIEQLSAGGEKDVEMVKYVGAMMQLERVLSNDSKSLDLLAQKIQQVERQLLHFDICESQVVAALADIYGQVISPLGPKIQVFGKPELLKQTTTQQKIRALLLAGIRSAVLWRQLGGKRRQFFFAKKKIITAAKSYM
ncbi:MULTISPECIES: high frequency lysogenization protein HflD [Pseudoalteromonas]|uniref:high frequency lysogenization protein HflD n=1 Tax=Pseudoalteromonas TaxID=53246 RepID=UPI000FFF10C6|nr:MULTISPECIES: high frequency lysogenization protein HflD [Pseudoalteromonas]MCG9761549.1 high frequency lysogenization protein HflD [Pseudoalteromonas sp. Isolate6]NKC18802.1 high frequency lysogenization protein HflD [Pseudoalteromonas galatheae]RXE87869.1 lysogenization regulator HflD [Pseudoalteromonas sp. A757]